MYNFHTQPERGKEDEEILAKHTVQRAAGMHSAVVLDPSEPCGETGYAGFQARHDRSAELGFPAGRGREAN
ncbi:hypothetical protein D3C74_481030 [compost metagenome]